ncbi:MAG: GAF domain-containing protein [Anaerolineae bacterium]|jgi:class 3 adenylate cyclase|nr:GAF domain-containing protein [Anaerolineae bacterium]
MLTQPERQIALLMALDAARDSLKDDTDPVAMFTRIVRLLCDNFHAGAGAIYITDDTTEDTALTIALGLDEAAARALCRQALTFTQPQPLAAAPFAQSLAVRVLIDSENHVTGSIILGREQPPFTAADVALLALAESQIDSAVAQARSTWRLAERNRELEAIFQIDRLRDSATDEAALLNHFTGVLVEHFQAQLCLLLLSHIDTGELVMRGMVDKLNVPVATLNALSEASRELATTQRLASPLPGVALLAAPLIVSGVRLGAVIIGRKRPFRAGDVRLLNAMSAQMDTAIAKSRTEQQLAQRTRELEAIYRIDHIRDQESDFDLMMQQVLTELCRAVSSETGYLILYNAAQEEPLELKAATRENILTQPEYREAILRVSREALEKAGVVAHTLPGGAIRSIIAVPLILNETIIGVFGAINSHSSRGFNAEDARMLVAITSQVDTAVFERLERRRMRALLSRSVDPKVLEKLLQNASDNLLAGERVVLSVLFADLRGSTEWAERTAPEELVALLNTFLGMMTDVIFKHGGTLDKFVGDEVIALFGSPVPMEHHACSAARAALEMQRVHEAIRSDLRRQGREIPPMGIGLSSGEVIAGEFGPPIRTDFTAMGRVMNLGARLCGSAPAGKIIVSETTRQALGDQAQVLPLEPVSLKGIGLVNVYELLAMTLAG